MSLTVSIIVVDDGSTDGSLEIIKGFGNRIHWETGPNRGGNPTRNRLLELARAEWLQYLDADDYLSPDKVARQMEFLAAHPGVDVVYGPVTWEYCTDQETRRELLPIPEPHDPWALLARWYLPQTGAPLWRRQAIVDVGGWKNDQPCCQEHELYLRLLMADKRFAYCAHSGAIYRQWGEHTVCKRDQSEVRRRRLEIEKGTEDYLLERGELTSARHWAINQARFEMARMAWQVSRDEALTIMTYIRQSDRNFIPSGAAAPKHYRFLFQLFGFRFSEQIASLARSWRNCSNI